MLNLRGYQHTFCDDINAAFERHRAILAVTATGAGKTVCVGKLVSDELSASAVTAHRKEIVAQISLTLGRYEIPHRLIAPADEVARVRREHLQELGHSFIDDSSPKGVASVQTLLARANKGHRETLSWLRQVRFSVLDEAHHYVRHGSWGKALDLFSNARILGVTATPERADGLGLGAHADGFAEAMIEGPQTQWLIENGFLSKFIYKAPESDIDLADIPLTASGDVNTRALRARIENSHIVGDCVKHYQSYSPGKRAIVFVPDVKTSEETADAFRKAGIPARSLDGGTQTAERARAMDDFKAGRILVLCNVDLFDEGLDVPAVEAVFLMRFTKSLAKYLQMCGRVLRIFNGKEHAIICDMVRNWLEHGPFHIRRTWSLDRREKNPRSGPTDTLRQRVCLSCTQPYLAFNPICPYCGSPFIPPDRTSVKVVEGDLTDLDFRVLEEMMRNARAAQVSGSDYELELAERNIPVFGRPAMHRRREEAIFRRGVLRNMIAIWNEAQPASRSLKERYRRFYYFFGIDHVSAGTLNASDTDKLCDLIAKRFVESVVR